jgi:hypothetical protein
MGSSNTRAAFVLGGAAVLAGCLVFTPLDDLPPSHGAETSGAAGGAAAYHPAESGSSGATDTPDAGAGAGGEAGLPSGGKANSNGACETNADCSVRASDEPSRCRPSDHSCVPLRSDACPLVYGPAQDPNALFFGSFAPLDPVIPEENSIIWSERLALDDFNGDRLGGLPGPHNSRRPLVMLVCDNSDAAIEPALDHLVNDVQVPAMLATLKPGDLRRAYEKYVKDDVFYLSPISVNEVVAREPDDGHIWALLGQPSDYVPTYVALLNLTETYLRAKYSDLAQAQLRVALVTTEQAFDSELAQMLLPALRFNGMSPVDNGDSFLSVTIGSDPNFVDLAERVGQFEPDIIISAASEAFLVTGGLQEELESDWEPLTSKRRPFYVLSPYNTGDLKDLVARISGMLDRIPNSTDNERYVGIRTAVAADRTLQNSYELHLRSVFQHAALDSANYYDAVYFLTYAMYGAQQDSVTGSGIASGMQRLLTGVNYPVGQDHIQDVLEALSAKGASVHVQSTLGPPDFDPETGVRSVDGAVLCFKREGTTAIPVYDALRYDRDAQKLVGKDFPCISGFYRP